MGSPGPIELIAKLLTPRKQKSKGSEKQPAVGVDPIPTPWLILLVLLSGMTENELKLTKTSCVEEVLGVVRV